MEYEVDALDRSLVTAMQMHPRATWTQLAPILHTSESTLSRRWDSLRSAGYVWSSSGIVTRDMRNHAQAGFVEVRCATGKREAVVDQLIRKLEVFSLVVCAGTQDLVCMVAGSSIYAIDRLVNEQIITINGVTSAFTTFASGVSVEGSEFRLGDLTDEQARAVTALTPVKSQRASTPTRSQLNIAKHLAYDARRPAADIARITGHSHAHVQRQIAQLQSATWFYARTDFSVNDFGLTAVYFWLQCPSDRIAALARFVQLSPGIRLAMPIVARANMLLSVWLPGLDKISDFERELVRHLPELSILDRKPQISTRKRLGIVLDSYGRRASVTAEDSGAFAVSVPGLGFAETGAPPSTVAPS